MSRLPKESKTIPIYGHPERGDGEDNGKYYRCWNCGFVCNVDRDALGDQSSRSGAAYETYAQVDEYGVATGKTRYKVSESSTGCPLCHSKNWRGDY